LNTQALERAAYQELISNISDINALTIGDRDAAETMASVGGKEPTADASYWISERVNQLAQLTGQLA